MMYRSELCRTVHIGRTEVCMFEDKRFQEKSSICVTQRTYQNLERKLFEEEDKECKP